MKYYYDDALQAAYMAREFGLEYRKMECPHSTVDSMIEIVPCINLCSEDSPEMRIYLDPNSYEILKPLDDG